MRTAPTAAGNPAALDLRKSLLAYFATKEQGHHLILLPCGKSHSIAALAAPIHYVRLIHLGPNSMLPRQVGDPIPRKMGFGFSERGTLRPESVAGK